MMQTTTLTLVGNPNSGKTTFFNALTGARQRVGNWPGVTVERKSGSFQDGGQTFDVTDLPGLYSLVAHSNERPLDFCVACDEVLSQQSDCVINVVDATNLERHLFLTSQLLEQQCPVVIVLNKMDLAKKQGLKLDISALQTALGCPVLPLSSHKKSDIKQFKAQLATLLPSLQRSSPWVQFDAPLAKVQRALAASLITQSSVEQHKAMRLALRHLEGDDYALRGFSCEASRDASAYALPDDTDILIASERYDVIHALMKTVLSRGHRRKQLTAAIDRVVLNRFLGIPVFLLVMYSLFFFAINVGGVFQDFFDWGSEAIFVHGLSQLLTSWHVPVWINAILTAGVGKGLNTTITFVPIIGAMFLFLSLLEASGYMARAAFVMDRAMRALGLPGKSFVPLIVGFGCNVPAIMATRTLDKPRDRILTILMSPFMSCGARLAIYAVFVGAFFPTGGQNVVFALYLIGVAMAVLTGFILRKTLLRGQSSPLIMEMPPYLLPKMKTLLINAGVRLKQFLWRAGKVIVPVCMLLGFLNSVHFHQSRDSLLAQAGKHLTPVFSPMGIRQDNWPATVGLLTGTLAKEVVVGTLNTLYTQEGHLHEPKQSWGFTQTMQRALGSIADNARGLAKSFSNPVLASAPIQNVNHGVYGEMFKRFDGRIGAFAYLLFILLYMPCVSATAATLRELNRGWMTFSLCWTTGLAYSTAVIFYQAATWARHPMQSLMWITGIALAFFAVLLGMRHAASA
ncbi:MAG: ferrous iron transport protein B [marine bacterium B5-7]|nr:MAG: ferrous iron transport protein B [marine bacterium B5-7]